MKAMTYQGSNWLEFLRLTDQELLKQIRVDVFKATGKGGQKKNKTSNAIRLTLNELSVTESASRSKSENLNNALRKLRLEIALDTNFPLGTRDSLVSPPIEIREFLNKSEIHINPKNPVFPILVGYLLNCYFATSGKWSDLAKQTGFTSSQIRKFIEKNNRIRQGFQKTKEQLGLI